MDVVVDGNPNFQVQGEPEDVLQAVAAVGDFLKERGRAIVAVLVDGRDVPATELLQQLEGKPLSGVALLEVSSDEVAKLVGDCVREFEEVLPELPRVCHEIAAVFQGDTPDDGYEPFHRLAEIWARVKSREALVAQALDLAVDSLELDGVPLTTLHSELNGYLEEALEAVRTGDCVLLGDLLEYELAPRAEVEARIVALLREHAHQRGA